VAVSVNWPDCITTDRSKTADVLYPTSKLPLSLAKKIAAEVVVAEKGRCSNATFCFAYTRRARCSAGGKFKILMNSKIPLKFTSDIICALHDMDD